MKKNNSVIVSRNGSPVMMRGEDFLMKEARIKLYGEINLQAALITNTNLVVCDMMHDRPIILEIQGHGGSIEYVLSILETIHSLKNELYVVCTGNCSSLQHIILACGAKKGNRYMKQNATILTDLFNDGAQEPISEIEAHTKKRVIQLIANATEKSYEETEKNLQKVFILNAEEALVYGIVDHICEPHK